MCFKVSKKKEIVELEQMGVILRIPKGCKKLTLTAIIEQDGKEMSVSTTLKKKALKTARKDFLDNVEFGDDYDEVYALTDEGKAYLNSPEGMAELRRIIEEELDKEDN